MTVKIGFIGAGGIAGMHMQNVARMANATIVGICDVREEAARQAAERLGARAYGSHEDLLNSEALDAVFICVPPFAHGTIEEDVARKGVHMLVEKPLGLDMGRVREKAEVLKESGVIVSTGYCLRYLDTVEKAKEFLKGREIAMVTGYYLTSMPGAPWWRRLEQSGGQLVEQTTHTLDMMRYLGGEMTSVFARYARKTMTDVPDFSVYDVGAVVFDYASGAVGSLTTTCTQTDHRTGVEVIGRDYRVSILGTTLEIVTKEGTERVESQVDFYAEQDAAFIQAVATGDIAPIRASYDDASRTLDVTLAATRSAETGLRVDLSH